MGKRGPSRTPTQMLANRGSWLAPTRSSVEPRPEPGKPTMPKWLSSESRKEWKRLIPMLDEMGILSKIDRNSLARYCHLWGKWRRCEEFLEQHGDVYPIKKDGKASGFRAFPQVKMADALCTQLSRIESKFGLSPGDRAGLQVIEKIEKRETEVVVDKSRFFKTG